jgi:hypothetical protein
MANRSFLRSTADGQDQPVATGHARTGGAVPVGTAAERLARGSAERFSQRRGAVMQHRRARCRRPRTGAGHRLAVALLLPSCRP